MGTNMFLINEQVIRLLEEGELCDGIKIYKRTDKTKVLIINQRIFDVKSLNTRHGTNIDRDLLEKVFRGYGFDVTVVDDKTLEELETVMESLVTLMDKYGQLII